MRNGTGLRAIGRENFLAGLDALIDIYNLAMQPPPEHLAARRGAAGQWWHDVVRAGLTVAAGSQVATAWLADSFEIAEVHVHPEFQRRGIGRAMLLSLTAGCPHRTTLLSAMESAAPARGLYRILGFAELLSGFSFPGNGPPYVVMGAVLPLRG